LDVVAEDGAVLQDDHLVPHSLADSHDPGSLMPVVLNDRVVGAVQVAADQLPPFVGLPLPVLDNGEVLLPLPVPEKPLRPRKSSHAVDLQNFPLVFLICFNWVGFVLFPETFRTEEAFRIYEYIT